MLSELLLVVVIGLIVYTFYKWATLNNDYFAKRNLPYKKPTFLLGSSGRFFLMYDSFPAEKMYGLFDFRKPIVVIRDSELLKQLAVKDFDHFEDHMEFLNPKTDDLIMNTLGVLKGQRWRDMRATLSPAFTGSKMREMFGLVTEFADDMIKYFTKQTNEGKKIDLEMKKLILPIYQRFHYIMCLYYSQFF